MDLGNGGYNGFYPVPLPSWEMFTIIPCITGMVCDHGTQCHFFCVCLMCKTRRRGLGPRRYYEGGGLRPSPSSFCVGIIYGVGMCSWFSPSGLKFSIQELKQSL